MKYYKIVDIGNFTDYNKKLLSYFYDNSNHFKKSSNTFWNPLYPEYMDDFLEKNDLFTKNIEKFGTIRQVSVLILNRDSSSLHIDADFHRGVQARLNIPLLNCGGSITSFFDIKILREYKSIIHPTNFTESWHTSIRNIIKPVCSVELIRPTILRTSSPHTVFCRTCQYPRISLTLSFEKDIVTQLDSNFPHNN
jgi:hypothetical protein